MIEFKISKRECNKFIQTKWHLFEIDKTIANLVKKKAEISKERDDLWREVAKKQGISGWKEIILDENSRLITATFETPIRRKNDEV